MQKHFLRFVAAIFVIASIVIFVNSRESSVHAADTTKTAIMISKSNVYKGPGKTYGKTGGSAKKGELVILSNEKNNWIHIQSDNGMGWISNKYVEYARCWCF